MCGITAYCGNGEALPFLMQGLAKLEYRGYDSAGVTVLNNVLTTVKCKGRLKNLEEKLKDHDMTGHVGIGHTRWATHGVPSNLIHILIQIQVTLSLLYTMVLLKTIEN